MLVCERLLRSFWICYKNVWCRGTSCHQSITVEGFYILHSIMYRKYAPQLWVTPCVKWSCSTDVTYMHKPGQNKCLRLLWHTDVHFLLLFGLAYYPEVCSLHLVCHIRLILCISSISQSKNNSGPGTEPWGTPYMTRVCPNSLIVCLLINITVDQRYLYEYKDYVYSFSQCLFLCQIHSGKEYLNNNLERF